MITTPLDPMKLPLASTCLIEASAGTGKTYTMVSLYLRLLLQAGENAFPYPLNVEQILVVTFTKDATQELRERIRCRVKEVKGYFQTYQQQGHCLELEQDPFLKDLFEQIKSSLPHAITRLQLAEQSMDRAAIFTIHGFCQRMLLQFAFDSGIHFNLEMTPSNQNLLQRLSRQLWREQFYNLPTDQAAVIYEYFGDPDAMVGRLQGLLTGTLPSLSKTEQIPSLTTLLTEITSQISTLKHLWLTNKIELTEWFENNFKQLKYTLAKKEKVFGEFFPQLDKWANNHQIAIPDCLASFLNQEKVESSIKKNADVIPHQFFLKVTIFLKQYNNESNQQLANYLYAKLLRQKLFEYRATHSDKGFDDLLRLLKESLTQPQGKRLAELIHHQYPFAMIDEFQDTDPQQFAIFNQIYLNSQTQHIDFNNKASGFIMIGDPKQAIYRFRGADIFTYFHASNLVQHHFTLDKNWRSSAKLVESINQLFKANTSPFLFEQIDFQAVKARDDVPDFKLNGQVQAPILVYQATEKLTVQNYRQIMAASCADCIQQWLKATETDQAGFADKKLQAKDIAILVRKESEAEIVRSALLQRGIPSVYLSERKNIFQTNTAQELYLLLQACLNPFNERAMLAALATPFFCLTSEELYQLRQDEKQWDQQVDQFLRYQQTWHWQGVLPMLYQLFLTEQIPNKLQSRQIANAFVENERTLTDLLHLAELLQQATNLNRNETALVRWYQQQLLLAEKGEMDGQDEQQLRLESEQDLVKVVTIHKSKGLEYGLVWLPFIGLGSAFRTEPIPLYHDKNGNLFWDLDNQAKQVQQDEVLAENLRLLYVALTRAKYQLALGLPQLYPTNPGDSALAYLLAEKSEEDYAKRLQNCLFPLEIEVKQVDSISTDPWQPQKIHSQQLQAQTFLTEIDRLWQVSSFTQLQQLNQRQQQLLEFHNTNLSFLDLAKEYDNLVNTTPYNTEPLPETTIENTLLSSYPLGYSPLDLPSGKLIGKALHHFLEKCDFKRPLKPQDLEKLALNLNLTTSEQPENTHNPWLETLSQWITQILATPLTPTTITLNQIATSDRLNELGFFLQIKQRLNLEKFNLLLQQHHRLTKLTKPLILDELNGFIRGFIDLVFRHQGKYYLIDYKSNFLGIHPNNYAPDNLDQLVAEHRYDLQYILYTLALHRYLRQKDPNYDYQRDFGGVFYLFLRGIQPNNAGQGIFFDKPSVALIEGLDQLWGDN